jgi:alkylhydroperoxidase family enzyme
MTETNSVESVYPRLQPPTNLTDETRTFLRSTKFYRQGRPLHAHQILSNHPRAAQSLNRFLDWGDEAVLSPRERRILLVRTSILTGCEYEWGVHSQQGRLSGELTADEIDALQHDPTPGGSWSQRERVLLGVSNAICRTDTLSDDEWATASSILTPSDIIESLIVIGYYRMCAGLINAVGVPSEGDLDPGGPGSSRTAAGGEEGGYR